MARNYRKEYDNYHASAEQRENRSSRNKARRKMQSAGVNVSGKDVHHKDGNPRNNSRSNLTTSSRSSNRSKNK